jgi:WhiB family redox-sensing transcriptional regulator
MNEPLKATEHEWEDDRDPFAAPEWHAKAACKSLPYEMFFCEGRGHPAVILARKAKAICATCPVIKECAAYGQNEQYGIWGGTTAKSRRRARRIARA